MAMEMTPRSEATRRFYEQVEDRFALPHGMRSEEAVEAVLTTLARRMSATRMMSLVGTLPLELRARLRDGVLHPGEAPEAFGRDRYLTMVSAALGVDEWEAERAARAVLVALRTLFRNAEVEAAVAELPDELRQLWDGEA